MRRLGLAGVLAVFAALCSTAPAPAADPAQLPPDRPSRAGDPPPDPLESRSVPACREPRDVLQPGTMDLLAYLWHWWGQRPTGGYKCRPTANGGWSLHADGRALDYSLRVWVTGEKSAGDHIFDFFVGPDTAGVPHAMARRFGIQELIWDCRIWSASNPRVRRYSQCDKYARDFSSGYVTSQRHENHVHIGVNPSGAQRQRTYWTGFSGLSGGGGAAALPAFGGIAASGENGYWLVKVDGGVFSFGRAPFHGSMGGQTLNAPTVAIAASPGGAGYRIAGRDGGVYAFGAATFHGSMGGQTLNAPVIGIARTRSDKGYWLAGSDGGVFSFGDAAFHGSMGGQTLNAPIVGIAATPSGAGYWLVGADGGVFSFGDALFYGSMGGQALNAPIVGIAPTPTGRGYWLAAADGGVFAFGDAGFHGSMAGQALNERVTGIAATPSGDGYWLVAGDGGVFTFGDAPYGGSVIGGPVDIADEEYGADAPTSGSGPSLSDVSAAPGAVSFESSARGIVRVTLQRRVAGRRAGGRCVPPRLARRNAKRCHRFKTVRRLPRRSVAPGSNRVRFAKPRRRGTYRVVVVAIDASGKTSRSVARRFRVR